MTEVIEGCIDSCDWRSDPDTMPAYRAEQIDEIMHALAILGEKNEEIKALEASGSVSHDRNRLHLRSPSK
jgi:hypothetical protein